MPRYDTAIDLGEPNHSQTQLITLVGIDKTVLDVGCLTGARARALAARGCRVSGVGLDPEAEAARDSLDELVIADLDQSPLTDHFKADSFDVVVFDSVLEHLADPQAALRDAAALLVPDGRILVTVPNVAHAAVRLTLLAGQWVDDESGLVERAHAGYCTRTGVCDLLESGDLVIEAVRSTVRDPMAGRTAPFANRPLPPTVVQWVRDQPDALDYEYIVAARPLAPGESRTPRPPVEPAVPYDTVRVRDAYSDEVSRETDARHHLLTLRDHLLGLEATVESTQRQSQRTRARAKEAERRLAAAELELERTRAELDELRSAGLRGQARRVWRKVGPTQSSGGVS